MCVRGGFTQSCVGKRPPACATGTIGSWCTSTVTSYIESVAGYRPHGPSACVRRRTIAPAMDPRAARRARAHPGWRLDDAVHCPHHGADFSEAVPRRGHPFNLQYRYWPELGIDFLHAGPGKLPREAARRLCGDPYSFVYPSLAAELAEEEGRAQRSKHNLQTIWAWKIAVKTYTGYRQKSGSVDTIT